MLISTAMPPLPANNPPPMVLSGLAAPQSGLGFVELLTALVGPIMNFFTAKEQSKVAKKQIGVEQAQLKQQKVENAQQFALEQAALLKQPAEQQRQDQVVALVAIGGAALLISGIFIYSAVKNKKAS